MQGRTGTALAAAGVVLILAACAAVPPEREERDRLILAALEPCKWKYSEYFARDAVSVNQDGRVRYFYWDHLVAKVDEVNQCISEAVKDLKVGPWKPGQLVKPGPANASISMSGQQAVVSVRVNGVPGTMAVNSNSQLTSVTAAFAKRAGLQIVSESPTTYVRVRDQTIAIPYARAKTVEVGEALVGALDVGVYEALPDHPALDGVLGNSFLDHFRVNVDRRASRVTLEPWRVASTAVPAGAQAETAALLPEITVTLREWRVPVWATGDEWRLRWKSPKGGGSYTHRVDGEEAVDGLLHYVINSGSRRIYFVKVNVGWHFEKHNDVVTLRRDPPMAWDWPLIAGKAWDSKYDRQGERSSQQYYSRCLALGETGASVPAGEFATLLVRCRNRAGRITAEYWYAEEVKNWVKRRLVLSDGERVDELVSYSLSNIGAGGGSR